MRQSENRALRRWWRGLFFPLWIAICAPRASFAEAPASILPQPPSLSATEELAPGAEDSVLASDRDDLPSSEGETFEPSFNADRLADGTAPLGERYVDERDERENEEPDWPDIDSPGPDLGDFPNSAYTLPKGRSYLEVAPYTVIGTDQVNHHPEYITPFLARYGLTDDVEFRLIGNGYTVLTPSSEPTGFSPLVFDLKTHLWDDKVECLIPACSLEVALQTGIASQSFNAGTEPSINLNFDLPITKKTNLEATVSYSGVLQTFDAVLHKVVRRHHPKHGRQPGDHDVQTNVFSYQWAVERDLTDRLQLFANGYFNGPGVVKSLGDGIVVGGGAFWKQNDRLMLFGSCNAGVTPEAPRISGQFGFAVALGPASRIKR